MKRREIKFVAGSLQLAPDRIEAASGPRKAPAVARTGRKAAQSKEPMRVPRRSARKRR